MKKVISILSAGILVASCSPTPKELEEKENEVIYNYSASMLPIASIWNAVYWSQKINSIIPEWASPHSFELSAKDTVEIENLDILFVTGTTLDWNIQKVNYENSKIVSKGVSLLTSNHDHSEHSHDDEEHDEHREESHEHDMHEEHNKKIHTEDEHTEEEHNEENHEEDMHEEDMHEEHREEVETNNENEDIDDKLMEEENELNFDPHYWLWIDESIKIAENIRREITLKEKDKAVELKNNTETFKKEISNIQSDFESYTNWKTKQKFIILHDAYRYLFEDLDIKEDDYIVIDEVPSNSASPAKMKELKDMIEEHNIKIIFKEPQMTSQTIDFLSEENNLTVLEIDPIWWENYIENLKSNLENLKKIYE